jgi:hypothetical protein
MKRLPIFQNKPFQIPYGRMNHLCRDWNKHMPTIVQNTLCNRLAWWLPLVDKRFVMKELVVWNTLCNRLARWLPLLDKRFVINKSVAVSNIFFWLGVTNDAAKPNCIVPTGDDGSSYEGCSSGELIVIKINETQLSWKQQSCQKMQTPAITLWFPEQCLLGFFILKKQLASQDMFLIRSKLSITAYLFLVLYRSISLQSLSFLKNIETFLCK